MKTKNKRKRYGNSFEQVFHLPCIIRNEKHDCNNRILKCYLVNSLLRA